MEGEEECGRIGWGEAVGDGGDLGLMTVDIVREEGQVAGGGAVEVSAVLLVLALIHRAGHGHRMAE